MIEKTEALNFRVESELKAAFVAACKANDVNAAQVLRAAMRQYLKDNGQAALPPKSV